MKLKSKKLFLSVLSATVLLSPSVHADFTVVPSSFPGSGMSMGGGYKLIPGASSGGQRSAKNEDLDAQWAEVHATALGRKMATLDTQLHAVDRYEESNGNALIHDRILEIGAAVMGAGAGYIAGGMSLHIILDSMGKKNAIDTGWKYGAPGGLILGAIVAGYGTHLAIADKIEDAELKRLATLTPDQRIARAEELVKSLKETRSNVNRLRLEYEAKIKKTAALKEQ